MTRSWRRLVLQILGVVLSLFVLAEVNYPRLGPQSELALFALLGLLICFLTYPTVRRPPGSDLRGAGRLLAGLDLVLALLSAGCCLYVVVQSEPFFDRYWLAGSSLGNRAGAEATLDYAVGIVGLLLVLEATRRTVGWALPILASCFLVYALFGSYSPVFPHRGYSIERIVSQTFLHSQGVFGTALSVMFTYVFLFVLFGALLESTGATRFIITAAQRLFHGGVGGPAKVSVLSSGLMGSLSGSAVANTATTGTFTIPLMRSSGFRPHIAAGVEAAASSGGALAPPVMGAGAYMMLEIIEPPVTYLQIIKAALWPAVLYYLSLLLIVHFYALRLHRSQSSSAPGPSTPSVTPEEAGAPAPASPGRWEGVLFFSALAVLVALLLSGYTVFRSVSLALGLVLVLAALNRRTRIGLRGLVDAASRAAAGSVALICAASCVGVVIGVVTLTGVGTKLPAAILPLAQENLTMALVLIMVSSIILGMGLPSAVCYLLMATLIGPVLGQLGVVPLAAHMFIFYFGMMSMVTPPVALAAYTAASIASANIMASGFAAFRFALVGFTLPYMFVYSPELLLLAPDGGPAPLGDTLIALAVAIAGIVPLAAGIAGYLFGRLGWPMRLALLLASGLLLVPSGLAVSGAGFALLVLAAAVDWRRQRREEQVPINSPRPASPGAP